MIAATLLGLLAAAACQTTPTLPDDALPGAGGAAAGVPDGGGVVAPPAASDAGVAAPALADGGEPAAAALASDGGTAAPGTADGGTPEPDPNADAMALDEGTSGTVSGMKEHGGWVPAEILAIEERVKGTPAQASSLAYVGGSLAPYCQELYRFRFQYGSVERFAEIAAFRRRSDAKDCEQNYRNEWKSRPGEWRQMELLQHRIGAFYLRFSGELAGEGAIRAAMLKAVEASAPRRVSRIPPKVMPAGSTVPAADVQRNLPPPPKTRKNVGVRKVKPKAVGAPPSDPMK